MFEVVEMRPPFPADPIFKRSLRVFGLAEDGHVIAWWGFEASGVIGQSCGVWAKVLSEPKAKLALARLTKDWKGWLHSLYPQVIALVSCDDKRSLRWIDWLGFVDYGEEPGYAGARRMVSVRGS